MLYCCNKLIDPLEEDFFIFDTNKLAKRHVEAGWCKNPKCNAFMAQLTQFNIERQRWEITRPTKKEANNKLNEWKKERYVPRYENPKQGTKGNMGFAYGKNTSRGQYRVDWNNTKALVKTYNI